MLTKRYLPSQKNLDPFLAKIIDGVAPDKFTVEHLKSIGFSSSNDRGLIPLLKDLGFLTDDGAPTARYRNYRNRSQSKVVMGDALREAYADLFHIREIPTAADRPAIEGVFRSKHNSSENVAQQQAATFLALLKHADLKSAAQQETPTRPPEETDDSPELTDPTITLEGVGSPRSLTTELHYTIQVHLPATKDITVYNAIFKSLRDNLL